MQKTTSSALAVKAFGLKAAPTEEVGAKTCAACGTDLNGRGVPIKIERTFNDVIQFADREGRTVCGGCRALMLDSDATSQFKASGAVSAAGFTRLYSNVERVAFLTGPPEPPFALSIVTAQRQHVWWMARVAYSPDLIPLQFGHRPLIIDRPRAIAVADAILDYEASTADRKGGQVYVLSPLSRDLRSPSDGQYTKRFADDRGNQATALRADIAQLTLGDLWATFQARSAARELKTQTVAEAGRIAAGILAEEARTGVKAKKARAA